MLAACTANGWPVETYTDPAHPLQVQTREIVAAFAGLPTEEVAFAVDNCAVPTFYLPLRQAARAFARLATARGLAQDLAKAAMQVVSAMTRYPDMVAGEDRFDTDLMAALGGKVVTKGGAEGFLGIGLLSSGLGVALKITDGNSRALPPAAMRVLAELGAVTPEEAARLESYAEPQLYNLQGEKVGRIVPVFAGENL
jgi:L-asparaginase II